MTVEALGVVLLSSTSNIELVAVVASLLSQSHVLGQSVLSLHAVLLFLSLKDFLLLFSCREYWFRLLFDGIEVVLVFGSIFPALDLFLLKSLLLVNKLEFSHELTSHSADKG